MKKLIYLESKFGSRIFYLEKRFLIVQQTLFYTEFQILLILASDWLRTYHVIERFYSLPGHVTKRWTIPLQSISDNFSPKCSELRLEVRKFVTKFKST